MRKPALAAACAVCITTLAAPTALAAPAKPNVVKTVEQPDGKRLELRLWGDEYAHGYETLSGHTVVYDARDHAFEYAARGTDGWLRPSGRRADARPPRGLGRHLRPLASEVAAARRAAAGFERSPGALSTMKSGPAWADSDTDIPFLAVEFSDRPCLFTPGEQHTNLFGGGATGPGDLDDYFREVSLGQFELAGSVIGQTQVQCLALPEDRDYYNQVAGEDDALAEAAVAAADPHVDFSAYDNDGDLYVDAVGIIYAGGGPHDGCAVDESPDGRGGDSLWPHHGQLNGSGMVVDGVIVDHFTIQSEISEDDGLCLDLTTIGAPAHEFGHVLGLPDLYDTNVGRGGVGAWSIMADPNGATERDGDTPAHFDAWSKAVLGWVAPDEHAAADLFAESIAQVETSGEVHQFLANPFGFEPGGGVGEYFLVENRQPVGFDADLPGCGLLVWHIDEAKETNQESGHSSLNHRLVDVDEADGEDELNANEAADDGDPFPGSTNNRRYSDDTDPDSKLYGGTPSNVRMSVRSQECGASMDAVFGPNDPPQADAGGPYTTPEGSEPQLDGSGSSDPDGDALTYAWGSSTPGEVFDDPASVTPRFRAVGDEGEHFVTLKVTDPWGELAWANTDVVVENVAPSVSALASNGPKPENQAVRVTATITDPGWRDTPSATVDWGDGKGPQPATGTVENARPDATLTLDLLHVYGDDGTFPVKVCPSDDDGEAGACQTLDVAVTNVAPQAAIDKTDAVPIEGVLTLFAKANQEAAVEARMTDPGSDDLRATWSWGDGSPDTTTQHRVDPLFDDPFPSPSVAPRDVVDSAGHVFTACLYDVGFQAVDDGGGASGTDTVRLFVTGTTDGGRQSGYWAHQYSGKGKLDHSTAVLDCYLEMAAAVSRVFPEVRDASTQPAAHKVLYAKGSAVTQRDELDRDLLTAWLNLANGAVAYAEPVDTDGDGTADMPFHHALGEAEDVRLDPDATRAQIAAQRTIVARINDTI